MFSYSELKKALYSLEGALGIFFLWLAYRAATTATDHVLFELVVSLILAAVGWTCLIFAIEAFCFRDDPDIWR